MIFNNLKFCGRYSTTKKYQGFLLIFVKLSKFRYAG